MEDAQNVTMITTTGSLHPEPEGDEGGEGGVNGAHVGIIVGVIVALLLITAVVLFIIFRKRNQAKNSAKKAVGGSGVYADTTAPLDEESKGMLKNGKSENDQVELMEKQPAAAERDVESSPLKENPSTADA